jgi:microcystin-dependent protein
MDEYLAVIKMFAGDYAPEGYMLCQGQTLSIQQYTALYSLIGNRYGGDGQTNFKLPNLCGKFVKGVGMDTQGTPVSLAQSGGSESIVPVSTNNVPPVIQVDTQYLGLNYIICVQGIYPPRP